MIYTPLIQKAIRFAIQIHELDTKKRRKGTEIPYVTHPLTVGLILGKVTDDENIIVAGLLHDIIEDCEPYGTITKESLAKGFNVEVARMVDDVTEQDKRLPWIERKMAALKHIKNMKHDSMLVKSADVLHNLSELNEDIKNNGPYVLDRFNATREETIAQYKKLIPELAKYWHENPLISDLNSALTRMLELTKEQDN